MLEKTEVPVETNFKREMYEIEKNTDTAKQILRDSSKLSWIQRARREPGQSTKLQIHVWICPYCGAKHPDYRKNSFIGAIPEEQLEDFFDDQLSLFKKDNMKKLLVQDVSIENGAHICRTCERTSTSDSSGSEPKKVVFQRTKNRSKNVLKVMLPHVPFRDLFSMAGLTGFRVENADPRATFTETLVFNFSRGTTFLMLQEENYLKRTVAIRDLTNSIWSDGPLFRTIFLHQRMNQSFYQQFNDAYPEENPFLREEMNPMHYIHLCRFQGFPKSFYDSIPFSLEQSVTLETPFRTVAKHLRTRDAAIAMVKRELPYDSKEIRRTLFSEKPGLLFFLRELKMMWEVLRVTVEDLRHMNRYANRDESQLRELAEAIRLDLFVKYLRSPSAVSVASELQAYPGMKEFLAILLKQVGTRKMLSLLEYASLQLFGMGEQYAYAAPFKKKEILNDVIALCKDKHNWNSLAGSCSEPVTAKINGDLKDMWIGNYRFKPVTCKQEYRWASEQLHNCLASWCSIPDPTPIVIVYHQFKIVAAIEILLDERMIQQARLSYNRKMDDEPKINRAYKEWLSQSGFEEMEDDF